MQELGLVIVILILGMFLWVASPSVTLLLPATTVNGVTLPFRQVQENGFFRTKNTSTAYWW